MKIFTKLFAWSLPAFLFVFLSISPASAVFFQSGDTLILPKDKKIDEAVFVSGSSLTINSDINGDLYCAGRDVVINGNVKGDIACVGQSLKVNGNVDGDIRAAAMTIEIAGQVTRNITVASQSLVLGPKSQVKGDIFFGVQNVSLGGSMGRDLLGAGETVNITGSLLRNATVTGTNLSVIETGKIGGNLDYYMEKTATASIDKKNIKGTVVRHDIETPTKPEMKKEMSKVTGMALVLKTIFGILSFAILGLALIYFDRKNTEKRIAQIINKPVVSGLIGFAVLITAPIAFIILMFTMVGMPLAFVALFVYIVALIVASLYPSAIYGKLVLEKLFKKTKTSLYWQMFLGVILFGLISSLPVIGWAFAFISFCMGLGAFLVSLSPEKK
jgi:cytoskeletal protein CcmA (bactofilin family)